MQRLWKICRMFSHGAQRTVVCLGDGGADATGAATGHQHFSLSAIEVARTALRLASIDVHFVR
jgi:ATP-dependent protease HslVU (ClpYQ) peptidase subunit